LRNRERGKKGRGWNRAGFNQTDSGTVKNGRRDAKIKKVQSSPAPKSLLKRAETIKR
jgi:hypothetical protein